MLQFTSAKFYQNDKLRSYEGLGITYSNYSWIIPIETCVATLQPVDFNYQSVSSYIIKYKNQIEDGSIASLLDSEIIEEFQLLCIFGLKSFFNQDKQVVESNCRTSPKHGGNELIPNKFVNRFFSLLNDGSKEEADRFSIFVEKVIDLPRADYEVIMSVLKTFSHSLQLLSSNIDLAYSMMIYCLESLTQNFDGYETNWDDYDQSIKSKLDYFIEKKGFEEDTANEIRQLLLSSTNSKLQQRFINFAIEYVDNMFFKEEANGLSAPLRKSDLKRVLVNAYKLRSGYVHELKEIEAHIKIDDRIGGEFFVWDKEPFLTYRGLVRLVHHIISNFIDSREVLKTEHDYDWYNHLAGTIPMNLHPQYWIGDAEHFSPSGSTILLSGFLSYLAGGLLNKEKIIPLVDLSLKIEELFENGVKKEYKLPMMAFYTLYNVNIKSSDESLVHQFYLKSYEDILEEGLKYILKKEYQPPMVNMYSLFNQIIFTSHRSPNYQRFIDEHGQILDDCSIESIITFSISGQKWPWKIDEIQKEYCAYKKKKYNKLSLNIPPIFELLISINIANSYLENEDIINFNKWMDISILDYPGNSKRQEYIEKKKQEEKPITMSDFLELVEIK